MELLRFATAGSVDDGKSTLIGRLLYDTKSIFDDQLEAVESTSQKMGLESANLALLTDGLRAEREQGITIDVAYRYFFTHNRAFIIADTPGHIQYTRNMVTGASNADLALLVVDVRNGVVEQTRRHAFLAALLGVPHLVICINKMDLVDFDSEMFDQVRSQFREFSMKLEVVDLTFIPVSALHGDNITERSPNTPWYEGASLLHHLEEVHIASDRNLIDPRFPVQYVIRPYGDKNHDYRGYAGTIAGGVFKPGDEVMVLPSGFTSTIEAIDTPNGPVDEAFTTMAATLRLTDDIDVSRGDMICRTNNYPVSTQDLDATICWMDDRADFKEGRKFAIKHTSKWARAVVTELVYRLDINTLHRDENADALTLNEIGRVRLRITQSLFVDDYKKNRTTGSFVLVDEATNVTVAAGMVRS
tara:strand:- start:131 stop:1378 length:1248 start_codon:yes stop_codon:yes gene_type:complete